MSAHGVTTRPGPHLHDDSTHLLREDADDEHLRDGGRHRREPLGMRLFADYPLALCVHCAPFASVVLSRRSRRVAGPWSVSCVEGRFDDGNAPCLAR